jgi:undecaprenyl pyrophosphate phosphatase UppP
MSSVALRGIIIGGNTAAHTPSWGQRRPTRRRDSAQILVGSLLSSVGAYLSIRFLTRWYETRSMRPFAIYCIVVGVGCLAWFSLR